MKPESRDGDFHVRKPFTNGCCWRIRSLTAPSTARRWRSSFAISVATPGANRGTGPADALAANPAGFGVYVHFGTARRIKRKENCD